MNIKECHVILDQSQRRISYVHLRKNTNISYIREFQFDLYCKRLTSGIFFALCPLNGVPIFVCRFLKLRLSFVFFYHSEGQIDILQF